VNDSSKKWGFGTGSMLRWGGKGMTGRPEKTRGGPALQGRKGDWPKGAGKKNWA